MDFRNGSVVVAAVSGDVDAEEPISLNGKARTSQLVRNDSVPRGRRVAGLPGLTGESGVTRMEEMSANQSSVTEVTGQGYHEEQCPPDGLLWTVNVKTPGTCLASAVP
jgi:hypothetical protein